MTLLARFQFSQNSLQDYADCPRRFQLRYLLRQPWPAVVSEPLDEFERLMEQGRRFHQLAQRHSLGLSVEQLADTISDDDPTIHSAETLRRWWRHYLESPPPKLPAAVRRAEVTLTAPLAGYRLSARYDLLTLEPGRRAVIVDWKTGRSRPEQDILAGRLQTRVYRFVLVKAGAALNGGARLQPEQVTMTYWFAEYPARPAVLPFDAVQFADDQAVLADLIAQIADHAAADEQEWNLTADERRCRFCTYRSLCERHAPPPPLADFDADRAIDLDLDFDLAEIEEISY